ncbi:Holliday junction branch migration protein RuvA, partial [uncultured Algoriphagus sp.]|nr:Holliday junction branch migration protein RuvA [Algoriphagus sp.]
ISLQTYSKIKDEEQIRLLTFLHIKEDAHTLYGFKEEDEKRLFLLLISINGVGPNTGLMILSSLSSEEIEQAILAGDVATIQHVKGIGAKTAQRIILELKDKVSKSGSDVSTSSLGFLKSSNKLREEALQALITLGFPKAAAEKNITQVLKKTTGEISLEDLIKASLKTT